MDGKTLRIGVVGAGFLAETRARCWRQVKDVSVTGVTARRRERAQSFAHRHQIPHVYIGLDEMLAAEDVDVVDLCVPNRLHRPMAEAAAQAKKHIICTKPLTAYVGQDLAEDASDREVSGRDRRQMWRAAEDDARAMLEAADQAGVRLLYGENWVYAPAFRRALGLLERAHGCVLEMRGGECHRGSHSPYAKVWRHTGGGALLRLGAHPLGAMLLLKRLEGRRRLGRPIRPAAVTAEVADLTRTEGLSASQTQVETGWQDVENWGLAVVRFEDGSRGVAYGSDNVLGGMESHLDLLASNCHLRVNLSPNDMLQAYAPDASVFGDAYLMEKVDSGAGWTTPMPDEDWTSGQLDMCGAFARALLSGEPTHADGSLGLEVVRVLYAAYTAAAEGRRVDLDLAKGDDPQRK